MAVPGAPPVAPGQGVDRRGDGNARAQVRCWKRVAEPARVEGDDARPGAARHVFGGVVGPVGRDLQRPLPDGHAQDHGRGQFAPVVRADFGGAAGNEMLGEDVERARHVRLGQPGKGAEQHRAAVAERVLEGRPGDDDAAQVGHGEAGGPARRGPAHPARTGRAVDQDTVAVAHHRGGDDDYAALVVGQAYVRQEDVVQQAVQFGPIGDCAVSQAGQFGARDRARRGACHISDASGLSGWFRERIARRPGEPGRWTIGPVVTGAMDHRAGQDPALLVGIACHERPVVLKSMALLDRHSGQTGQ